LYTLTIVRLVALVTKWLVLFRMLTGLTVWSNIAINNQNLPRGHRHWPMAIFLFQLTLKLCTREVCWKDGLLTDRCSTETPLTSLN
jgi:hypothetical protein